MHHSTRNILLLLSALILTHCSGKKEPADTDIAVTAARTGITQTYFLLMRAVNTQELPGASLGMYVSNYMINESGIHVMGATNGAITGLGILQDTKEAATESFALLEQLGIILQANIPDMLNRSPDRQKTLDIYIDTLTSVYDRSKSQVTALKQQQKNLLVAQHDGRSAVTGIQHDLNLALQKQDYATASTKQSEIIAAKAIESKAEAEVSQINSTITLYNNLNKIANRRLAAITANREPLIAGLTVVDVPGITDLGILEKGKAKGTTNSGNPFGN